MERDARGSGPSNALHLLLGARSPMLWGKRQHPRERSTQNCPIDSRQSLDPLSLQPFLSIASKEHGWTNFLSFGQDVCAIDLGEGRLPSVAVPLSRGQRTVACGGPGVVE